MAERDDYSEYPDWMMGALARDPNAEKEADNFDQRWGDLSSSATPSATMSDPFELAAYRVRRSVPVATKPPAYAAGMQAIGDVAAMLPMTKGVEGLQLLARTAPRVAGWLGAGAGLAAAPGLIEPAKRAFEQSQSRLDTGEYDPEPVVAATMYGLSPQTLYTSTAKEMQGTLGALGGRPPSSTASAFGTLQTGAEKASQDYTKSLVPPPTSFMDRIWNNYAKRMTPDELLQSEPLWGGAQQLAQATGMSEQQAFAHVANNMLERMGTGTRLTPEAANQITGEQRGAAMLSDVLRKPQAQSGGMGDIADQQAILRDAIVRGRSGRPIRTAPLPIGTEDAILQRGYDVATGQVPPGPQPPFTQAAARKGPVLLKAGGEEGVAAPAILPRQMPTAEDINAIKAAARGFGHNPWPTAERPIFKTTPEAYNETSQLVPQVSIKDRLPGPLPGEKLPGTGRVVPFIENADAIGSLMAERLQPLVQAQSPLLKFYSTGPVIRGLERYGEAPQGPVQFMRDWAGQGAATSPRTKTPPNLRNASFLLYERARGNPMTRARFDVEGNEPGYSMMGMHVDLANAFAHGTENPLVNPKPTTFRENWAGNLLDVTGDTHVIRGGLHYLDKLYPGELPPGWFTNAAAYDLYRSKGLQAVPPGGIKDTLDGRTVAKAFRQAEYLPITEPTYRAAQQLGIAPAEVQSGGWFSLGDLTNLRSPPKTIPHLLNDQIEATARAASVSNETALNWWSRGLIPLAGVAGAAKMGELARQDDYQQ